MRTEIMKNRWAVRTFEHGFHHRANNLGGQRQSWIAYDKIKIGKLLASFAHLCVPRAQPLFLLGILLCLRLGCLSLLVCGIPLRQRGLHGLLCPPLHQGLHIFFMRGKRIGPWWSCWHSRHPWGRAWGRLGHRWLARVLGLLLLLEQRRQCRNLLFQAGNPLLVLGDLLEETSHKLPLTFRRRRKD
jgi:hypothetical protein